MSTTLREGELQVSLPKSVQGRKFDDETHGMSHCMKAVDWIIDLPDEVYIVEVKDLDARGASGREARRKYLEDLQAGRKDRDFVGKFRDSFIYQWACERVDKPIVYLVIIACEALGNAMLLHRADELRRKLPSGAHALGSGQLPRTSWSSTKGRGTSTFPASQWSAYPNEEEGGQERDRGGRDPPKSRGTLAARRPVAHCPSSHTPDAGDRGALRCLGWPRRLVHRAWRVAL